MVIKQQESAEVIEARLKANGIDIECARGVVSKALGYQVGTGEYPAVNVATRNQIDRECKKGSTTGYASGQP